jgi:ribosomal protein S27E
MAALRKWSKLNKTLQNKILTNVWCGNCGNATTIVDYDIHDDSLGFVLRGKCKKCGGKVARFVEDE